MQYTRRTFIGAVAGTAWAPILGGAASRAAASEQMTFTPEKRKQIEGAWLDLLGPFPPETPKLQPEMKRIDDIQGIECRRVTFQSEPEDRIPAYLLVPRGARERRGPAIICVHPTTHGSGKRITIGLSGQKPDDPPFPPPHSRAYGLELARWGYVTLSIDLMCDGERIPPGLTHYDTREFYRRHPEWSAVGKNIWDMMRSVDFLLTLDFTDPSRIACLGHSLGGHTSLFAAAFDTRIAAAVCNGGVYSWRRDTDHWSRPERENAPPIEAYVYIRKFRPYVEDPAKPTPTDFDELMMLVAPRPLLLMQTEEELKTNDTVAKAARAAQVYRKFDAGDRITLFSYPGEHNYPPVAKRFSFSWLDRWLDHTPAVPTIWPDAAI
jgi:dienelactone hydrolase